MRLVRVDKNREVEVPENWREAEQMITNALGAYYDGRAKISPDCRSQAVTRTACLAASSWPPTRCSRCFTSCSVSALAAARGSTSSRREGAKMFDDRMTRGARRLPASKLNQE
jgi:hypothetical protein